MGTAYVPIMEIMDRNTIDAGDFIRECTFMREPLNCSEIVEKVFDGNYGQCFAVDVKKAQKVHQKYSLHPKNLSTQKKVCIVRCSIRNSFFGCIICICQMINF